MFVSTLLSCQKRAGGGTVDHYPKWLNGIRGDPGDRRPFRDRRSDVTTSSYYGTPPILLANCWFGDQ